VPDRDRLGDFNRRRQHQKPAEEQHRGDGRRYRARDGGDAEQNQSNPESQKPSPVLDEVVRELNLQSLNIRCRHVSLSPQSSRRQVPTIARIVAGAPAAVDREIPRLAPRACRVDADHWADANRKRVQFLGGNQNCAIDLLIYRIGRWQGP
jgi:hypothetical protein